MLLKMKGMCIAGRADLLVITNVLYNKSCSRGPQWSASISTNGLCWRWLQL